MWWSSEKRSQSTTPRSRFQGKSGGSHVLTTSRVKSCSRSRLGMSYLKRRKTLYFYAIHSSSLRNLHRLVKGIVWLWSGVLVKNWRQYFWKESVIKRLQLLLANAAIILWPHPLPDQRPVEIWSVEVSQRQMWWARPTKITYKDQVHKTLPSGANFCRLYSWRGQKNLWGYNQTRFFQAQQGLTLEDPPRSKVK